MASMATKICSCCSRLFYKNSTNSLLLRKSYSFLQVKPLHRSCSVFWDDFVSKKDRETKSYPRKTDTRNYTILFGLPLAVLVSTLVSTPTAFCGHEEDTPVKAQATSANFIFSRARKAEKRKAATEKARAERCKRRLFQGDEENITLPFLNEPRTLRENPPQRRAEESAVSGKDRLEKCP